VKIDRIKLNTLLKSGLNPEIKTRKHLAAQLGLDPTSLTRWFASRDRLGNPRYPVVPDRHVANILQIFNLAAESLTLDDERFRQHCLEVALRQAEENDDSKQKALLRLENIARRKLTLPPQSKQNNYRIHLFLFTAIVVSGIFIWRFNQTHLSQSKPSATGPVAAEMNCWTGYSDSLGYFDEVDMADPCHYGKLFHKALEQLKASNENALAAKSGKTRGAQQEYILFLAKHLQQRRIDQRINLNIELGRLEFNRANYTEALSYFRNAEKILAASPNQNAMLLTRLSNYIRATLMAEIPMENTKTKQ